MIPTPGTNWQLMLADLSIILFLTTFSALAQKEAPKPVPAAVSAPKPAPRPAPVQPPAIAEPVAVWRAGQGAPPLGDWLKGQPLDDRMRINVHGGYREGRRDVVLHEAAVVSADPALTGRTVRLILEPASADAVTVTLSYDAG